MNFKIFFLMATFFVNTAICNAQSADEVYSRNKEANSYYLKALGYIKIGSPRNGGSVDCLSIAVQWLEKALKTDPLFVTAYIELCKTYWLFDFSYPNFPKYNSSAVL